jgi:uncharacterized protein (TIGR02246 family)
MQQTSAPTAAPDTRAADEAAIRAALEQWGAAARAKDAAAFTSFYAENAWLFLEAAPDSVGKAAIEATFRTLMQDPNFALSIHTSSIVVASSGDLAYERGSYELTLSDANQQPALQKGNYVTVWNKQADGTWKVVIDSPTSDPPPAVL